MVPKRNQVLAILDDGRLALYNDGTGCCSWRNSIVFRCSRWGVNGLSLVICERSRIAGIVLCNWACEYVLKEVDRGKQKLRADWDVHCGLTCFAVALEI